MQTQVFGPNSWLDSQVACLRAFVARDMMRLPWRHSGLGMLQAYVREGKSEEVRVHVWDPRLRRAGIESSGLLHDHRFDMTAHVLLGRIVHVEYELRPYDRGAWQLHEVVHARKAMAEGATFDGGVRALPGRYEAMAHTTVVDAGGSYRFPALAFHGTWPDGLTVTAIHKQHQRDVPARIMAPYGQPVVHAFADPMPPEAWTPILLEAQVALLATMEK